MKEKKNRGESDSSSGGESSWMVTFSDLATLLLTFFVLLLSMSSLDEKAFRSTFHNFNKSSGILFFRNSDRISNPKDIVIRDLCMSLESLHLLEIRDIESVATSGSYSDTELNSLATSGNRIWLKKEKNGENFSFIFGDRLLFESGNATLNSGAFEILEKLADFLRESEYFAAIDGHTDDIPIHNETFASNDQLSLARAQAVLNFFLVQGAVDPKKLTLGGYGSTHPFENAATTETRALNRRVEILFRKST